MANTYYFTGHIDRVKVSWLESDVVHALNVSMYIGDTHVDGLTLELTDEIKDGIRRVVRQWDMADEAEAYDAEETKNLTPEQRAAAARIARAPL